MNKIAKDGQIDERLRGIYPEYEIYEDAYTLAMDEFYPIKYIVYGMTNPFKGYKNKRPPTEKFYIFEYVLSGKGHIYVNGKWQTLESGCMYIIGKNDERNFHSDENDPMHKLWISFASEYIDSMLLYWGVGSGIYRVDARGCFEDIYALRNSPLSQQEKLCKVAENIHRMILLAASTKTTEGSGTVSHIENELISSIYSKISLDDIAGRFFMTKANLIRIFKKHMGITPYQFLLNERIKVAKALLSTTDMSVKSISEKLCFADEHYFSAIFKQKVGLSPLKYKASKGRMDP